MDAITTKLDNYFAKYPLKRASKGQILVFGGENPRSVYYMVKGKVKQYDISQHGEEVVVNVFQPPAFFPMSWAINDTLNRYFFEAETAIEFRSVPADKAVEFLKKNPDVTFDLLSRVFRGMDSILERMAHIMGGSAKNRVIFELITSCRRYGRQHRDGSCSLEFTEAQLGNRAGLSRETVSRNLKKLADSGLISVERSLIKVSDLSKLESLLGSDL